MLDVTWEWIALDKSALDVANTVAVEDESAAKRVMRLIEALEDNDDVQDVYANFDIPEQVLEAVAS